MAAYRSLYNILNVSSDAEPVVIEAAYRALMKKYHPDQGGTGEQSEAAEINGAFATLRDPESRSKYDRREWQRQQEMLHAQHMPAVTIVRHRTGLLGWTGWLVATVLGAVIVMSMQGSGALGLRPAGMRTAAASLPQPQLGSQPAIKEDWLTPAVAASVEADLAEMRAIAIAPPEAAEPPAVRPGVASPAKHRRPREPKRRAPSPSEADFLEREGYIY